MNTITKNNWFYKIQWEHVLKQPSKSNQEIFQNKTQSEQTGLKISDESFETKSSVVCQTKWSSKQINTGRRAIKLRINNAIKCF